MNSKMFSCRDEVECQKLVTFYVVCTSIYFPSILFFLFWSRGIYMVGKCSFQTILLIIVFAEVMKYCASVVYIKKSDFNLLKKPESHSLASFIKSLFTKSKVKEGCKTIVTVFAMIMVYFTVSVLYGAEIFAKHEETFMFSALLSVLTVLPICINLGCHSVISVLLGFKPSDKLEYMIYQNLYFTMLGAWIGAFVIPLDWDRPWQKWPIPCSCGAMMGFLISHFFMILHVRHAPLKKRMKL